MENWLTYLFYGAIFFVMMRFGCGSHGRHGKKSPDSGGGCCGGKSDEKSDKIDETDDRYIDPVCHSRVDTEQGYGKMHQGLLYRFCSRNCLDKFEEEPDRFIKGEIS